MKKYLLLIVIILSCLDCFADEVITTFTTTSSSYVEGVKVKARLYQVKLTDFFTYVTIELTPLKNSRRMIFWTSDNTYVESGNAKLPLLGVVVNDNTYHSCTYNDRLGWNYVKAGQQYYYTLIFSGRIPEGQTNFTLKDYAPSYRGFTFSDYTIKNPKTHFVMDELYCRTNADLNNDGICGIYEEIGGSKYRLACIKENGQYYLIYLGCADRISWWFTGDLKAYLEESATLGAFKAKWIMKNKTREDNVYIVFDGSVMKSIMPNGSPSESSYMKMYPSASSSSRGDSSTYTTQEATEWSGTGFALKGNYLVTNHHVVEDAKSIWIQGVNGDFNTKHTASVVANDKFNDLALLKVEGVAVHTSGIPYSVKTSTSEVGEDVFVLGYPLTSTMGEEIKLTTGVVSSKTGYQGDVSLYQISAPIQPGNSGGPLFDGNGNVIGVVSAKHTGAENVGYAIKASYLRNLTESALSENILPQTNKIASYKLSDKVKSLKNYVYYITCSSSGNSSSLNNNYIGGSTDSATDKTYNNPYINRNLSNSLQVLSVKIQDNQTVITFSVNNKTENGYHQWLTIDKNAYIVANGQRYTLIKTDEIAIAPNKTYFSYAGETKTFTLYFPAIPKNTTSIDFIETEDSDWRLYGIQLR